MIRWLPCALLLTVNSVHAIEFSGHLKPYWQYATYPDDSFLAATFGNRESEFGADLRLNFSARSGHWDINADYELIGCQTGGTSLPGIPGLGDSDAIDDSRRWWNLTDQIQESNDFMLTQRMDRLNIGYTGDRFLWRFGRQAISWGNGLFFNPMDIFNPFSPTAVDREYKTGDDMFYSQVLMPGGDDVQAVLVLRRDPADHELTIAQSSLALKYHGFIGDQEIDVLAARHFDSEVVGLGTVINVGGAIVRGDVTWTKGDGESWTSVVASISQAWTWGGHNVSAVAEYFHNGLGQQPGDYRPLQLAANTGLLDRIERGELFTLGRDYLALSATVELNPLLRVTPNLFVNLGDPSALAQLVVNYDWQQDLQLLAALLVPVGPDGSEYGGIPVGSVDRYASAGPALFLQLGWYF